MNISLVPNVGAACRDGRERLPHEPSSRKRARSHGIDPSTNAMAEEQAIESFHTQPDGERSPREWDGVVASFIPAKALGHGMA